MRRSTKNPIITPADLKPSRAEFKIDCVFNCGVTQFNGQIILLLRVAESLKVQKEGYTSIVYYDAKSHQLSNKKLDHKDKTFDFSDTRVVLDRASQKIVYLTSLSHFRIARATDLSGESFVVDEEPFLFTSTIYESFGCEDPRVTLIEGRYYINYTAVSSLGISTALAVTDDFVTVKRLGIIFAPDNRDVAIFPEKISNYYYALHRPMQHSAGKPEIWLAKSPDLSHWGDHRHLLASSENDWDAVKNGGGTQILKTEKGWLEIYHGVDKDEKYCLGALLLDLEDPSNIIAKSKHPLLEPQAPYELEGFFGNVVFSCGAIIQADQLMIYYGASDEVTCLATITLSDLWLHLGV